MKKINCEFSVIKQTKGVIVPDNFDKLPYKDQIIWVIESVYRAFPELGEIKDLVFSKPYVIAHRNKSKTEKKISKKIDYQFSVNKEMDGVAVPNNFAKLSYEDQYLRIVKFAYGTMPELGEITGVKDVLFSDPYDE